jgi:hypothetical protein
MVNHYHFYGVDTDFGPFFVKFCSNGVLSCAEPGCSTARSADGSSLRM